MMAIRERILLRKPDVSSEIADELIQTTKDRLLLRAGIFLEENEEFPVQLDSIVVEVVVAMINQHETSHEGVASESINDWKLQFINNLLEPYDKELINFKANKDSIAGNVGVVKFI